MIVVFGGVTRTVQHRPQTALFVQALGRDVPAGIGNGALPVAADLQGDASYPDGSI